MPLNRPECRPQKFVMVTQVAAGRLVPPFNPRASRCHPPIHPGESVPPPNPPGRVYATPQSTSRHVRMVPPVSSSPAGSAGKSKPVPPVSPKQCHPSVPSAAKNGKRRQDGATRQFRGPVGAGLVGASPQSARLPEWCHSSIRSAANLVPPPNSEWPTGATPQSGGRKWRRRSGPLRPVLLPSARSDRFQVFTHRHWLCWLATLNEKLLA